jgi:DNA-binding transcriptional MerR regulator
VSYEPKLTASLSGATIRQLAHWRNPASSRGAILVPEVSHIRPILYSFRDVVALRTCVRLRQETSLQKIRLALNTLREDLGEREHLSSYVLVAENDRTLPRTRRRCGPSGVRTTGSGPRGAGQPLRPW